MSAEIFDKEIFDKVAKHLLTQNKKSVNEVGKCRYRGLDGLTCAVGCLIKDECYTPKIEGRLVVSSLRVTKALTCSGIVFNPDTKELLRCLQEIHDLYDVEQWRDRLQWVAKFYGLNMVP